METFSPICLNPPTSKFIIYGLFDPRTNQLRYVGKSTSGLTRPKQHQQPWRLKSADTPRLTNWIKELNRNGYTYVIKILDEYLLKSDLVSAEIFFIQKYRNEGYELTNISNGGDGEGRPHTEATKQKLRASHLGKKHPPRSVEFRIQLGNRVRGKKASPETRKKISEARRNRPIKISKKFQDQNGNIYFNIALCSKALNIFPSNIRCVLKGIYKQAKGYTFTYLDSH